ncbi:MAG TPA: tetratricopeptide repeat protein [Candidatus Binatia bacterium]|nr:tetratricopeptide repeat protein [Candidatus Binatia bacterium]
MALVASGVAFLYYYNGERVALHLGPESRIDSPLALLLLGALALGAGLVLLGGLLRAGATSLLRWRARRDRRRRDALARLRDEGRRHLWAGELESATRLLVRVVEGAPEDIDAALALARAHEERGEIESARRVLETARAQHGPDPRLLSLLGHLAMLRSNAGAATDALREATGVAPESPRLLGELAEALAAEGRFGEAVEAARRRLAVEREPGRREHAQRAWLALRYREAAALGETPAGNEALRRLVSEAPDFVPAVVLLAARARAAGDGRTAERVLREAIQRRPRGVLLEGYRALHVASGQAERALATLRDACSGNHLAGPRLTLARALVAAGKLEAADADLKDLARDTPRFLRDGNDIAPERDLVTAELALARGHDREAANLFSRAAAGSHRPFGYRCTACQRAVGDWIDHCACGAYGSYEWVV